MYLKFLIRLDVLDDWMFPNVTKDVSKSKFLIQTKLVMVVTNCLQRALIPFSRSPLKLQHKQNVRRP